MNELNFERPVSIFVGAGYTHAVDNVHDAHRLLSEWDGRRGPAYSAATNACHAAFEGSVDAETVRGIFEAFAKAHGILVPEVIGAAEVATMNRPHG